MVHGTQGEIEVDSGSSGGLIAPRPPRFADLQSAMAAEAVATMISEFGGQTVYIPKEAAGSVLADRIGVEQAAIASGIAGGLAIRVPASLSDADMRSAAIELRRCGMSVQQIAVRIGVAERTVYRILSPA